MVPRPRVHLVDASPYVFRAFHSLPSSIVDRQGRPAGAVRGFADFLLRLLREERPTHLGVAFDDSLTSSFRNRLHAAYKTNREPPPAALEEQIPACRDLVDCLGGRVLLELDYEADDLIGAWCASLRGSVRATVVSPDKDLMQVVGGEVELLDFATGRRYGPRAVEEKLGVPPRRVPDLLALAGDPVDNVPGVRGIGRKSAVRLLAAFDGLEGVYASLEAVEKLPIRGAAALRRKLEEGRESAFLSLRLVRVADDPALGGDARSLLLRRPRWEALRALLHDLGSDSLATRARRQLGH